MSGVQCQQAESEALSTKSCFSSFLTYLLVLTSFQCLHNVDVLVYEFSADCISGVSSAIDHRPRFVCPGHRV